VEIAPGIGLSHGIFDIVSTGSTLLMNGLKEVAVVARSEAVLIANTRLDADRHHILDELLFRIRAVLDAVNHRYILLNAPNEKLREIGALLPGMKSPTILPLAQEGWSSVHTVVKEDRFWNVIAQLKALGAEGILIQNIEKMVR
jgi:ATP phosphoribosyltransferase